MEKTYHQQLAAELITAVSAAAESTPYRREPIDRLNFVLGWLMQAADMDAVTRGTLRALLDNGRPRG